MFLCVSSSAQAFEPIFFDWEPTASRVQIEGSALLGLDLYSRPSAREGESAFVFRDLSLLVSAPVDDNAEFTFKLKGPGPETGERSATTKRFLILIERAQVNFYSGFDTYFLGIVAHPWEDRQSEYFNTFLWGPSSYLAAQRFKYVSLSDQGLVWRRDFSEGGQIQLAVLNGEENRSEEIGPKKEAVIVWDQPFSAGWLGVGIVYGGYEQFGPDNQKIRALLRWQSRWGKSTLGFEALWARDPADAVTLLGLAEGVELNVELPGQKTTAQGGTLWWLYQLQEIRELFLKLDYLNPSQEVSGKSLWGLQLALVNQWSESVNWVVYFENLEKQPQHSHSSLQNQRLGLSVQLVF